METLFMQSIFFMLAAFAIGGVGSLCLKSDKTSTWWGSAFALLGSSAALFVGVRALTGPVFTHSIGTTFPFFAFEFHTDKLAGIFLMIIGVIGFLATIYGAGYMRHYFGKYRIGAFYFFYNLFLASMALVVLANQALFFLVAWELMALTSYFLVVFDHTEKENVEAGSLYFIFTHVATACIFLLFLILYTVTGSFDFDVWRTGVAPLTPLASVIVFALAILGFGTKAGIIPLHIWLPNAHPAAPSHVSALMSGVMIKTGIYMLIRVLFDFFHDTPIWLGLVVLSLGALSSVLGILYALGEHDIKRMLAYSSIENIGIILLCLGAALLFRSQGTDVFMLLALVAALYHTVNHALFKSLLFMGAGAVFLATHTRNMEKYGGLIKRMPETAFFFLLGAIAISGIIPFNGFVSEWLAFQSLFSGILTTNISIRAIMIGGIAALAFTGGLAALAFVRAFGITFLARPRSKDAAHASEVSSSMRLGMALLSVMMLGFAIMSGSVARILMSVSSAIGQAGNTLPLPPASQMQLSVTGSFGSLHMPLLLCGLLIAILVTWIATQIFSGKRRAVVGKTWDCGFPLSPRMEITATGFARSIITIFAPLVKPTMSVVRDRAGHGDSYFIKRITVALGTVDVYRKVYDPIARFTLHIAARTSKIQTGSTHVYLLYMMIALLVLLAWATH